MEQIWLRIIRVSGRLRFTLAILIITTLVGIFLNLHGNWSAEVQRFAWDLNALRSWHVWAAWQGLFAQEQPLDFYGMLLVLLLTVGVLEYRKGLRLAFLGFLVIGPLASILTLLLLWPLSAAGLAYVRTALFTPDSGASTACLVCLGILLTNERGRWRFIALALILGLLAGMFYRNQVYNFDHLNGFLIGIACGSFLSWWRARGARRPALLPGSPG